MVKDALFDNVVPGAVKAWGRIEVHADGLRAEYAEVVALAIPEHLRILQPAAAERVKQLAIAHGASLVAIEELEAAAREFGDPVAHGDRPSKPTKPGEFHRGGVLATPPGGRVHVSGWISSPPPPPSWWPPLVAGLTTYLVVVMALIHLAGVLAIAAAVAAQFGVMNYVRRRQRRRARGS